MSLELRSEGPPRWPSIEHALTLVLSGVPIALYAVCAFSLVRYPWDWSPDEGLFLDYGRRAIEHPALLYAKSAVPVPLAYGPVLPALLGLLIAWGKAPLADARVLALAWTLAGVAAIYVLVRRQGGARIALAFAALSLAPFDLTFFHMLVRVDGLMITLWLLAAVFLLPARLRLGSERLSGWRMALGSVLLVASVLTKPTAVIHGAPLVLGWWWVDRRSAWKLGAAVAGGGLASLALLQWASDGGFLWAYRAWLNHPWVPGLASGVALEVAGIAMPLLLLALVGAVLAWRSGETPLKDGSILLLIGGLLILPSMGKYGATGNYLLPAVAAVCVCGGRFWSVAAQGANVGLGRGPGRSALLASCVAASVALTREFPLPTAEDERTAQAFYSFVSQVTRETGPPILVSRPEYAYYLVGQPVEIEATGFALLLGSRAPGTERVVQGLEEGRYHLLAWTWPWAFPVGPSVIESMAQRYRYEGKCGLQWYFGRLDTHFAVRRDIELTFTPPASARCSPAPDSGNRASDSP